MNATQLVGKTNDTTSWSATSVTSLQRVWVTTLTQIVLTGVNNNGSTQDRVWTNQLDQGVRDGTFGNTRGISADVTQVTNVSGFVGWGTMGLAKWIEVGTSRGTTVGVVTKLMDVETTLSVWRVTGNLVRNCGWGRFRFLGEVNDTRNTGITSENSNCTNLLEIIAIIIGYIHLSGCIK